VVTRVRECRRGGGAAVEAALHGNMTAFGARAESSCGHCLLCLIDPAQIFQLPNNLCTECQDLRSER
jgi:hypothetical protein